MFWPPLLITRLSVGSNKIIVASSMGPASGLAKRLSNPNVLDPQALNRERNINEF